jgi:hypothetical protein
MNDEEKQDRERLIMAAYSGEPELYIEEAKKFVYKYLPQKAINGYLSPSRVYTQDDYVQVLSVMIHNFTAVDALRWMVEMDRKAGREPDPSVIEDIKEAERLGF